MSSPPTWEQLIVNPELATLHLLGGVLAMAQRVLLCAHPELEGAEAASASACSAMANVADSILTHIDSLEEALQRYPQEIQRHHQRLLQEEREIPF